MDNDTIYASSMSPETKALWLADLRSANFKQGFGMLRDCNGGFCCLGVLAQRYNLIDPDGYGLPPPDQGRTTGLVAESFGLSPELQTELAWLNDQKLWTFEEIADWIETYIQTEGASAPSTKDTLNV